jgi:hypothetical protein
VPALFTLIGAELDYHTTTLSSFQADLAKKGSFHPVGQIEKADTRRPELIVSST